MLFLTILVCVGFYSWRRLHGLQKYTCVLEKKISNLRKENKELHELIKETGEEDIDEVEVIMNKIFHADKCIPGEVCKINREESQHFEESDDKREVIEIPDEPKIQEIQEIQEIQKELPDVDLESIVSESNPYNKKKLSKMSLDKIKEICVSMNISTEGTKATLIDKIISQ